MPINRYYLADFLSIQRQSFFTLLETGLIEEFKKRNPITSTKKDLSLYFYPEYYVLTRPEYSPQEAIFKNKSYTSKLFVPVQFTDKKQKLVSFKWVYIGNLPMMTKRGHFILNGAARVIVNQIIRSPGVYYQQKLYENYEEKWSQKADDSFKRYYADLICMRGTWLRIEMDKEKNIWAQMKKGPKIPMYWFLLAMGLSEKRIFKSVLDSEKLIGNLEKISPNNKLSTNMSSTKPAQISQTSLTGSEKNEKTLTNHVFNEEQSDVNLAFVDDTFTSDDADKSTELNALKKKKTYPYLKTPPEAWAEIYSLMFVSPNASSSGKTASATKLNKNDKSGSQKGNQKQSLSPSFLLRMSQSENGRKWLYNRFMNPRSYDLGKQGRLAFNKKFGLTISPNQTTLTGLDVLYATDYLIKVDKGIYKIDDIDHLKNRRVRTSGELIGIQIGVGLVRLEKYVRDSFNKASLYNANSKLLKRTLETNFDSTNQNPIGKGVFGQVAGKGGEAETKHKTKNSQNNTRLNTEQPLFETKTTLFTQAKSIEGDGSRSEPRTNSETKFSVKNFINHKAFNSSIREFFGTSPLSQFMDQINPLAELTHKRRLSSMGPGGVTRDTATLAIRGIHPTHYGRICPIETPEGKNTGLVNSMTTYARVNANGIIESPFYKVYKGQVQRNTGIYYFSAEQEEKIKLAAADLSISNIDFLPCSNIPVRISEDFTKIPRSQVQYIGISPLQMISIAASLIPFLEHDDANRALMGSNMQRQAVPLIRPERAIVGTGLEARAVSDSGHVHISKYSGVVTHVSAKKIIIYTLASDSI